MAAPTIGSLDPTSDPALSNALWMTAAGLDFGAQFVDEIGPAMPGPHNTFIEAGIPTVAVIEQAYPYRHTTQDTLDKIDPISLARGRLCAAGVAGKRRNRGREGERVVWLNHSGCW